MAIRRVVCLVGCVALFVVITFATVAGVVFSKETTLSFWFPNWNDLVRKWLLEECIPAFEKENPGVKVNVTFTEWGTYEDKLMVAFAGNASPDIFMSAVEWPRKLAVLKLARPLNDYVKAWGEAEDFFSPASQNGVVDGTVYALPWSVGVRTIIYRKDFFEEAGLDSARGPETWEELEFYTKKLLRKEGQNVLRFGLGRVHAQQLLAWIWINGGEVLDPTATRALLNCPEGVETLEFAIRLHNLQVPGQPIGYGGFGQLAGGRVAMVWDEIQPTVSFAQFGIEPRDVGLGNPPKRKEQSTPAHVAGLAISSQTRHPDLAWKFIEFLERPRNLLAYNIAFGRNVPRKSLLKDPYFATNRLARENMMILSRFGRPWLSVAVNWMDMQKKLQDEMNKAFAGQVTPRQALDNTALYWNNVLGKSLAKEQPSRVIGLDMWLQGYPSR